MIDVGQVEPLVILVQGIEGVEGVPERGDTELGRHEMDGMAWTR